MVFFPLYNNGLALTYPEIQLLGRNLTKTWFDANPVGGHFDFMSLRPNGTGEPKTRIDSIFSPLQQWSNIAIWKNAKKGWKMVKNHPYGRHLGFFQNGGRLLHFQQFHLVLFLSPYCPLHIPTAKLRPACNVYGGVRECNCKRTRTMPLTENHTIWPPSWSIAIPPLSVIHH